MWQNSAKLYSFSLDYSNFNYNCSYPTPPKYKSPPHWLESIANFVQQLSYYLHAKCGAFTPKCTIFSPYGWTQYVRNDQVVNLILFKSFAVQVLCSHKPKRSISWELDRLAFQSRSRRTTTTTSNQAKNRYTYYFLRVASFLQVYKCFSWADPVLKLNHPKLTDLQEVSNQLPGRIFSS